jgi:hypothetical protein
MRINKYLFPILLLVIFLGVIALGMAAGYWETKGGGRRQHESAPQEAALVQTTDIVERSQLTWLR